MNASAWNKSISPESRHFIATSMHTGPDLFGDLAPLLPSSRQPDRRIQGALHLADAAPAFRVANIRQHTSALPCLYAPGPSVACSPCVKPLPGTFLRFSTVLCKPDSGFPTWCQKFSIRTFYMFYSFFCQNRIHENPAVKIFRKKFS